MVEIEVKNCIKNLIGLLKIVINIGLRVNYYFVDNIIIYKFTSSIKN